MRTQIENIKEHLNTGKSITPLEALNLYGCFRLSAVIFKLKRAPYNQDIKTHIVSDGGKHWAKYYLLTGDLFGMK